jgi:membrane protein involved in colicin uptake
MRFTADPGETSLADRGSVPSALIDRNFQYVKADGSTELRKFAPLTEKEELDKSHQENQDRISALEKECADLRTQAADALAKGSKTMTDAEKKTLEALNKKASSIASHLADLKEHTADHHAKMGKAMDAHNEHVASVCDKCSKALGANEEESEKALKDLDLIKADANDPVKKAAAEKAAADKAAADAAAAAAGTLTKADTQKLVDDAVAAALAKAADKKLDPNDPVNKVKLRVIGRDGKEVDLQKRDRSVIDPAMEGEAMTGLY